MNDHSMPPFATRDYVAKVAAEIRQERGVELSKFTILIRDLRDELRAGISEVAKSIDAISSQLAQTKAVRDLTIPLRTDDVSWTTRKVLAANIATASIVLFVSNPGVATAAMSGLSAAWALYLKLAGTTP